MHHKNRIISTLFMGGFLALSLTACDGKPTDPYPSTTTAGPGDMTTTTAGPTTTAPTTTTAGPVDSELEKLPKGSATVTAPSEVLQYQGFDVSLRLAKKALAELIEDTESEAPQGAIVQGGIAEVRMSDRMKAELIGKDFVIEDKGEQEQVVTHNEDTVWTWRVHSELPGLRVLKVRLHTLLRVTGQEAPRIIDAGEAFVTVKVNPSEWALRHWEWIATALVLPIVGWGLKRRFDKDRK